MYLKKIRTSFIHFHSSKPGQTLRPQGPQEKEDDLRHEKSMHGGMGDEQLST